MFKNSDGEIHPADCLVRNADMSINAANGNVWIEKLFIVLRRARDANVAFPKPTWDRWANREYAATWQAVALALDIDPQDPLVAEARDGKLPPVLSSDPLFECWLNSPQARKDALDVQVKLYDFGIQLMRSQTEPLPDGFPQPRSKAPNWVIWRRKDEGYLWQIVALSLNISPGFVGDNETFTQALARQYHFPVDFFERLDTSQIQLDSETDKLPGRPDSGPHQGDAAYTVVSIRDFAAFAQDARRRWPLRMEFPNLQFSLSQLSVAHMTKPTAPPADLASSSPLAGEPGGAGHRSRPVRKSEYRTLLKIIGALVGRNGLDTASTTAGAIDKLIKDRQLKGPSSEMIESFLKLASTVIKAKNKKDENTVALGERPERCTMLMIMGVKVWGDGKRFHSVKQTADEIAADLKQMDVTTGPETGMIQIHLKRAANLIGIKTK
jgi:hypothetical protein